MKKFLPLLFVFVIVGASCTALMPSIVAFDATPATINAGSSATLVWNVSGANSVSIDQGLGILPAAGSQVISPSVTTIYTLTASNIAGRVSKSAIISVNPVPVVINVDINPAVINSGGSAALIWRVSGANSVSIDQGIGNVSLNGERLVSPTATTTYIITATGNAGTVSKSVVLTVNPPVVATFTVDPSTISAGQLATLQWNVTGATSVSIDQGIGKVAPVSSKVVSPYYTTTYTLTASSSCCTISKSVVLTVGRYYPYWGPYGYDYMYPYMHEYPYMYGRPFIDILNITPSTITSGDSATLSWYVTGASSVFITGIGNVSSSGSRVVSPSSTTTYTMTASNYYGTTTGSVTVNVE